jgi:hypothetical protein
MPNPLVQHVQNLRQEVAKIQAQNARKQAEIAASNSLVNPSIGPVDGPKDVHKNLGNILPDYLVPGNLGDVNKVVWPFWFTNQTPELPAASTSASQSKGTVTITQEAAFIVTDILRSVFVHDLQANTYTYVDPNQPGQVGLAPGLSMILVDGQSRRQFMSKPIQFDHMGFARFPFELPTAQMFLPNSIIETQLFNSNTQVAYVPWITFIGVRCRIEDAQRILSLVTG